MMGGRRRPPTVANLRQRKHLHRGFESTGILERLKMRADELTSLLVT